MPETLAIAAPCRCRPISSTPMVASNDQSPDGNEIYRSYLGFKTGVLHPGDIIETWGKGGFFGGDPEFVDQEGINPTASNSRSWATTTVWPSRPFSRRSGSFNATIRTTT